MPTISRGLKRSAESTPCLAVQVGDDWRFWRLDQAGNWQSIDAPSNHEPLWRVCDFDWLSLHGGRSKSGLNRMGLDLLKDRTAAMKVGKWAAFTREGSERVAGVPVRPIALALRDRVKNISAPSLLRMELPGDYSAIAIYRKDGAITGWTLASQEDIELTGQRLATQAGVSEALFENMPPVAQVVSDAPQTRAYPIEPEWRGVPVAAYRRGALGISAVILGLSASYWFAQNHAAQVARTHDHDAMITLSEARHSIQTWDVKHVNALARQGGIDPRAMFAAVYAVYVPGSTVSLLKGGKEIVVSLPFNTLAPIGHGQWTSRKAILQGLGKRAPRGWVFKQLARSGQGRYSLVYVSAGGHP